MLAWLDGKKTYLSAAFLSACGVAALCCGQTWIGLLLIGNGSGLASVRHALAKLHGFFQFLLDLDDKAVRQLPKE